MPELKPCPFCGSQPESKGRPATPGEDTKHVWFLACFCGGYSAKAHHMGSGETPEEALADAAEAWNNRAIPADQVLVPRTTLERFMQKIHSDAQYDDVKAARAELSAILQR